MGSKNVRATINALEVGQSAEFPLRDYDYVLSCRTRLQTSTGRKFSSRKDKARNVVVIKRKILLTP